MAFTHTPDPKPCFAGCRLKKEDHDKFDSLTRKPGKKQRVIEKLILDYTKSNHVEDKSLLQHIHAKGKISDSDFNRDERKKLRGFEKRGFVEVNPGDENNMEFFWKLTDEGRGVVNHV